MPMHRPKSEKAQYQGYRLTSQDKDVLGNFPGRKSSISLWSPVREIKNALKVRSMGRGR